MNMKQIGDAISKYQSPKTSALCWASCNRTELRYQLPDNTQGLTARTVNHEDKSNAASQACGRLKYRHAQQAPSHVMTYGFQLKRQHFLFGDAKLTWLLQKVVYKL